MKPGIKRRNLMLSVVITAVTAGILLSFGRPIWCQQGDILPWSFDAWSPHSSQHILDWYTPSHISHGLLFCLFFLRVLSERLRPYAMTFSVALEACWEVLENSSFIIDRYRQATASLDYVGDSVMNSVSDIGWCWLGFIIASRISTRNVWLLFLFFEIFTLVCIRDNLSLNVLMLLYPIDAIKEWQMP